MRTFFSLPPPPHPALPSFPTRRSSDLLVRAHLVHHSFIEHTAERTVQQDVKVFQGVVMANLCGKGIPIHFRHFNIRKDRKSTRLNSSHVAISYAVFCLKKKTQNTTTQN